MCAHRDISLDSSIYNVSVSPIEFFAVLSVYNVSMCIIKSKPHVNETKVV